MLFGSHQVSTKSGDDMKQKLLAIALAGAFAAPAMADVTISGTINAGPYYTMSGDASTGSSNSVTALGADALRGQAGFGTSGITSNYSNINIRSEEDLGNGLKALFQYQIDISQTGSPIQSTNSRLRTRNSYLGLGGNWGAVKFGTNENIYEQYLYQADPLDGAAGVGGNLQMFGTPGYGVVFDVGQGQATNTAGQAGFYRRTDQNLWFESADYGGITFGISYSLPAYKTTANGTSPQVASAGVQFKPTDGKFYVNLAYEWHKDLFGMSAIAGGTNLGTSSTDYGLKLQGGIMLGDMTIGAIIEQLKYETKGAVNMSNYDRIAYGLNFKYALATGYIGANLGLAQDGNCTLVSGASCGAGDSGATYFAAGYFHNLSKQTQLQVIASFIQNKSNAWYINAGASTNNVAPGADHTAVYLGIKHSF